LLLKIDGQNVNPPASLRVWTAMSKIKEILGTDEASPFHSQIVADNVLIVMHHSHLVPHDDPPCITTAVPYFRIGSISTKFDVRARSAYPCYTGLFTSQRFQAASDPPHLYAIISRFRSVRGSCMMTVSRRYRAMTFRNDFF
jgi:hypothetical protein